VESPKPLTIEKKVKNAISDRLSKTEQRNKNREPYNQLPKNDKLESVAPTPVDP
jgi:hypothetical protein